MLNYTLLSISIILSFVGYKWAFNNKLKPDYFVGTGRSFRTHSVEKINGREFSD